MTRVSAWLLALFTFASVSTASAAPGAATLVAPSGDVSGSTITFSWQSEPTSTWYLFWLGKGTPTAFVMEVWYTAEHAGCASGGTCSISLTPPINAGSYTWFIQTWNSTGTGPWSTGKVFTLKEPVQNWSSLLPASRRFTLVLDGVGVLDNETGLVWERTPSASTFLWAAAIYHCTNEARANRKGWRLATATDLGSLTDAARSNPALPEGHPFVWNTASGGDGTFWTQTISAGAASDRMWYSVYPGSFYVSPVTEVHRAWCVRSPSAAVY